MSAPHDWLGRVLGPCDAGELEAVRDAVSRFLCVTELRNAVLPLNSGRPPKWSPFPHHANIYCCSPKAAPPGKMYAVLPDDDWNGSMDYTVTARLTSQAKDARARWESQVRGGCIVVGDLVQVEISEFSPTPPRPPRPSSLQAKEKMALGAGIAQLLVLP